MIDQSLDEQFPNEEGYQVSSSVNFKFKADDPEPHLKLNIPLTHEFIKGMEPLHPKVGKLLATFNFTFLGGGGCYSTAPTIRLSLSGVKTLNPSTVTGGSKSC